MRTHAWWQTTGDVQFALWERACLFRVCDCKPQLPKPSPSPADAVSQDEEDSETEVDPQATAALLASTPLASGPVIWPRPPAWAPHKAPPSPSGRMPSQTHQQPQSVGGGRHFGSPPCGACTSKDPTPSLCHCCVCKIQCVSALCSC